MRVYMCEVFINLAVNVMFVSFTLILKYFFSVQVMFHLSQLSCSLSASTTQVINGLKTLCAKKIDSSHEIHNVICNESLDEV